MPLVDFLESSPDSSITSLWLYNRQRGVSPRGAGTPVSEPLTQTDWSKAACRSPVAGGSLDRSAMNSTSGTGWTKPVHYMQYWRSLIQTVPPSTIFFQTMTAACPRQTPSLLSTSFFYFIFFFFSNETVPQLLTASCGLWGHGVQCSSLSKGKSRVQTRRGEFFWTQLACCPAVVVGFLLCF